MRDVYGWRTIQLAELVTEVVQNPEMRSISKTHTSPLPNQPPWLMLPTDQAQEPNFDEDFEDSRRDSFFNLAEKKLYKLDNRTKQRPCQSQWWLGSSQGWLLCFDKKQIPYMFNPFFDVIVWAVLFLSSPKLLYGETRSQVLTTMESWRFMGF
ncbi:hypothetical protein Acr_08g0014490 [Actinidia rufa]|uniref:Uncharacterized protein n=1 Tax=Actinidia rufa TaxID=165716 RepID=A0A7J0F355_9ERIC|nr:hypothetical protein Acr_08g0014490 [Actinidia rufa]